ncbi:hypothetical protein Ddye_006662 [Dipteronia dyeriana]|uniref:ZCF37 n=1 Tax=Dipteronia dyeriana TaxID=168575 RepID=A0AAE0CQX0_9ROSI|nr:hypothetical protein Ddye_006662 [Dipteronia dyeriana]
MMESPTTPEGKPRKKYSFCNRSRSSNKNKDSKNPYSNRGREKFSALLSELEEKKKKILSKMGSDDISHVRFVYRDSDECVPVIVKLKKEYKKEEKKNKCDYHHYYNKEKTIKHDHDSEIMEKFLIECLDADFQKKEDRIQRSESDKKIAIKKKKFSWNSVWRHPSYYFPVVVILILLLLAFFGRSFVIICASMGWYIIPTIKGSSGSSNVTRAVKKKDYLRRCSDKNIVSDGLSSPKITKSLNNSGNFKDQSLQKHNHRQSW